MNRTCGVANRPFHQLAGFERGFDRRSHVAEIIHGIEDTENIDTIGRGAFDEGSHDIIGIVVVADHVLATQEHLKTGFGHGRAQLTQAFPRVFFKKTQSSVERRAAPSFQRPVADIVELSGNRQHILRSHSGCD